MNEIFDLDAWREVVVSSLAELGRTLAGFLPSLVGMVVILAVGWCVAKIVELLSRRALHRVGLDRTSERIGIAETLRNAGIGRSPSELTARILFWLLMLTFLLSAFETLGLTAVTTTIDRLIIYLPRVIGAGLIVVLGMVVSGFSGNLVTSGAAAANLVYARGLGAVARGIVLVTTAILATEQLGIDTQVLVTGLTALVATFGAGLALAFALGSRDVVRQILAGHYLRQTLRIGQRVEIGTRSGTLERVGATDTLFRDGDGAWSIPNARLLGSIVVRPSG